MCDWVLINHSIYRVDPPIVGHYHILDIKKLACQKYVWKIFAKNSCKTIHHLLHVQGITKYLHDYDGGRAHSKHAVFLEARIFPNFYGS